MWSIVYLFLCINLFRINHFSNYMLYLIAIFFMSMYQMLYKIMATRFNYIMISYFLRNYIKRESRKLLKHTYLGWIFITCTCNMYFRNCNSCKGVVSNVRNQKPCHFPTMFHSKEMFIMNHLNIYVS